MNFSVKESYQNGKKIHRTYGKEKPCGIDRKAVQEGMLEEDKKK